MIEWALYYALTLGRPVIPLHYVKNGACSCGKSECDRPARHPITWRGIDGATIDEAQIRKWWAANPHANIGLVTGWGLIVIDVDFDKGGAESLRELERVHGRLPQTVEQLTPHGRHLSFTYAGPDLDSTVGRIAPGIDTRCARGYVVAHPSKRLDGEYKLVPGRGPTEIPVAKLPTWVVRMLTAGTGNRTGNGSGAARGVAVYTPHMQPSHMQPAHTRFAKTTKAKATPPMTRKQPRRARAAASPSVIQSASAHLASMPPAISGDRGHRATFRAAMMLVDHCGLSADDAFMLLRDEYNKRCKPRWSEKDLHHKVDNAVKAVAIRARDVPCLIVDVYTIWHDDYPGEIDPMEQLVITMTPVDPTLAAALPQQAGRRCYMVTMPVGSPMHVNGFANLGAPQLKGRHCDIRPDPARPGRVKYAALAPGSSAKVTP